jgi:hypothetical protein
MRTNPQSTLRTGHKAGFASTLYVLGLAILLLGTLVAVMYPHQVQSKNTAAQIRRQTARNQMEVDAYNIARGTVGQIAIGMEDPGNVNLYNHTQLQYLYTSARKGPAEEINRIANIHKTNSVSIIMSNGEVDPRKVPTTPLNLMGNPDEQDAATSTVFGPVNGGYTAYNLASDTGWGSTRYTDPTFSGSSPFNSNAASLGLPVLHPNYTYGLGHPAESATSYTIRNTGSFQSPVRPVNLNPFSGWGFYVNPRATNGFALYPPEFFPGLAVGTEPMLGRLHLYRFDRVLPIGTTASAESLRYRVRVMLMEVPYQGALEYEGELRVNNATFWNKSSIRGLINSDRIQSTGGGSLGSGARVLANENDGASVEINAQTQDSSKMKQTGTRDMGVRKNTDKVGETGTMVKAFLINPATLGTRANRRNWFEWPAGLDSSQWFTSATDTNSKGGPTIDQYSCGVLQADLHLRVDKISGGAHRLRIHVYKTRSDSSIDYVGHFTTSTSSSTTTSLGAGYGGGGLDTSINVTSPDEIRIDMQALINGIDTALPGDQNTTNRQWPIRGIAVYRDPTATWTLQDPTVIITNAYDLNKCHEGLTITSQFPLRISQNFNTTPIPFGAHGILKRYLADPYLPVGPHYIPAAIYAPSVGYFESGGSSNSKLNLTGSISQKGSAPFLPPTTSGTNPIIDNRTTRITRTGAPVLDVYGGTMNGYENITIQGIRHQVQLPPIVPIRWLITYIIEEQNE